MRPLTRPTLRASGAVVLMQVLLLIALAAPAPAAAVGPAGLNDKDLRTGVVAPTTAQLSAVQKLGAHASWTGFGTPASLIKYGGWLATGLSGSPEAAARSWIASNRALFKLSDTDVLKLDLVASSPMKGTSARAVLFRQRYGNLPAGQDGLIIVGIVGGKIAYVSSSASGTLAAPQAATLSATAAWLRAAAHVGRPATAAQISNQRTVGDWTAFSVAGFQTPSLNGKDDGRVDQRARLVAVPSVNGARAAWETIVLDTSLAEPLAYTVFVDARSGNILMRYNQVDHAVRIDHSPTQARAQQEPTFGQFSGTTDQPNNCGVGHPIPVPVGTRTIDIAATANDPTNDITIALDDASHNEVATNTETGTSPEALHYEFGAPVGTATTYYARVCQFSAGDDPFAYEGVYATNDQVSTATDFNYPPKWKYFNANPSLANDPSPEDYDLTNNDARVVGCWVTTHNGVNVPLCTSSVGSLQNLASRVPWDHNVQSNTPTYTTIGNNAVTGEAWTNPLAPGPAQQRPVHLDRQYIDPWTNAWNDSKCNPANLVPGGNDIDAATTSLFAAHNRMHDWAYFLGFTEETWNLQTNNFGNNPGPGQEDDPEFGQVQAGALTGGAPSYLGRDNANQITLPDGVPGITNMYLWQPIAGSFYPPCVDGDYDFGIIGHEYTHAISNRMAGGPDANLSGPQASAMGEGWSDLAAIEYLNEFGLVPTNSEDRYLIGAYATGNKDRGIRNYNVARNPLNYSDFGYDMVCSGPLVGPPLEPDCPDGRTEEHSDAEIWMAANFDIRQALISKYNGTYPASNAARQKACAQGKYPASSCPGNRRWMQIMFDAWLLMPAATSMLDARDAYLAADMLRFNGKNQTELWRAFARRGMGIDASTTSSADIDPKPDFRSPREGYRTVKFRVFAADEANAPITTAKIYVGQYEAGVTPIADTIPGGAISDTANFVNGDYEFLVVAPGYGFLRFPRRLLNTGALTLDIYMSTNRASLTKGAVATGTGTDVNNMFDDTEATNWTGAAPVGQQFVTVDLQGGVQNVKRVQVSALLNPDNGGRFHALRQFEIWTCNGNAATCAVNGNYTKIYTSPANAFPGVRPRPVAPDLLLRSFDVPDTNATHVQLRVVTNQCTATGTGFRGEQDNDPQNTTDCVDGSDADLDVKAAELQVFSSTPALPPADPAVAVTVTAPATASSGSQMAYTITYTNAGPNVSSSAKLTDQLPEGVEFVSASNSGKYDAATRTVTWTLGDINVGYTGTRTLTVAVSAGVGTVLANSASISAPETTSVSLPAVTEVVS